MRHVTLYLSADAGTLTTAALGSTCVVKAGNSHRCVTHRYSPLSYHCASCLEDMAHHSQAEAISRSRLSFTLWSRVTMHETGLPPFTRMSWFAKEPRGKAVSSLSSRRSRTGRLSNTSRHAETASYFPNFLLYAQFSYLAFPAIQPCDFFQSDTFPLVSHTKQLRPTRSERREVI